MPDELPVPPRQSAINKARQLLEIAEANRWLHWDTMRGHYDPDTGKRTYRLTLPGDPTVYAVDLDEVEGFVFGVAATHGPTAVNLIRYRRNMTEE